MGKKKGKAQNGRAKQKQKAKGNTSTPRTPLSRDQRFARQMLLDDDWDEPEDNRIQFRGFSQGTPSGATPRSANSKLRHQVISFVSAGVNSPTIQPPRQAEQEMGQQDIALDDSDDEDEDFDDEDIDDGAIQTNIIMQADMELSEQGVANMNITADAELMELDNDARPHAVPEESLPFVIDTIGDPKLAGKPPANEGRPTKRSPSPTRSDSSEEVVVFHGRSRGKPTVIDDPVTRTPTQQPTAAPRVASPHITDDLLKALNAPTPDAPPPAYSPSFPQSSLPSRPAVGWGGKPSKYDAAVPHTDGWTPAPAKPYWKKGKGRATPRPDLAPSRAEVEAFEQSGPRESKVNFTQLKSESTETSVAALRAEWRDTLREKKEPKKTASRRSKNGRKQDNRAMRKIIISDDEDEGGESEAAYDDYMENLKAQLEAEGEESVLDVLKDSFSHSRSIAGPSMVVDGQEFGEDELLPSHMKTGPGKAGDDSSEWETSDSEMNPDFDELSSDESLNASDLEEELEYNEREQWEDEEDLRQRRFERMTDEQIARLLAKQEELGMNGDELLLDDGAFASASDDGFGDVDAARAGLSDMTNSAFARAPKKHGMRRNKSRKDADLFPDATMLADTLDQYGDNGFDIMDLDRPSLRPTKKGRKGKLPPELEELSDDDLREEMRHQWDNDRAKKRQKKLEREELRAEGLLGSAGRKGKADLSVRYPLGMSLKQIHDELRDFLQNEDLHQRAFPPMDKINRKSLHEICTALNLKSKSQGAGKNRFPIIYKTAMTQEYSDDMFGRVLNASTRGFLTNAKAKKMSKQMKPRAGRGGGFSKAATGLRDGEVVGAGAAELSRDNFGHRMMEKMGWTKGAGLGKDGEGRLHHVEQVMRTSKAGLG